jgi:hypothetical protein
MSMYQLARNNNNSIVVVEVRGMRSLLCCVMGDIRRENSWQRVLFGCFLLWRKCRRRRRRAIDDRGASKCGKLHTLVLLAKPFRGDKGTETVVAKLAVRKNDEPKPTDRQAFPAWRVDFAFVPVRQSPSPGIGPTNCVPSQAKNGSSSLVVKVMAEITCNGLDNFTYG